MDQAHRAARSGEIVISNGYVPLGSGRSRPPGTRESVSGEGAAPTLTRLARLQMKLCRQTLGPDVVITLGRSGAGDDHQVPGDAGGPMDLGQDACDVTTPRFYNVEAGGDGANLLRDVKLALWQAL